MRKRDTFWIYWTVLSVLALWLTHAVPRGESFDANVYSRLSSRVVSREHRYQVDVRVRPLLFWIRKSDIGDGRLTWLTGPDGAVGYELLVGSDPARTPRHINRWGYLGEESGPGGANTFGVMSQSDEQSVEEANKNTTPQGDSVHVFKAMRQHVTGSRARITVSDIRLARDTTYSDVDALLALVPGAPSRTRISAVPGWTSPGFLAAAVSQMEAGQVAARVGPQPTRQFRVYPFNGKLYELQLVSAETVDHVAHAKRSFGPAIRSQFRVLNRTTGERTPFTVVYGTEGSATNVPLLISFRPRWWLEIECVLDDRPRN